MKSVVLSSWHPDAEVIEESEPMDQLERVEWLITAGGAALMALVLIALLVLD
jgi:hypothetical protein